MLASQLLYPEKLRYCVLEPFLASSYFNVNSLAAPTGSFGAKPSARCHLTLHLRSLLLKAGVLKLVTVEDAMRTQSSTASF